MDSKMSPRKRRSSPSPKRHNSRAPQRPRSSPTKHCRQSPHRKRNTSPKPPRKLKRQRADKPQTKTNQYKTVPRQQYASSTVPLADETITSNVCPCKLKMEGSFMNDTIGRFLQETEVGDTPVNREEVCRIMANVISHFPCMCGEVVVSEFLGAGSHGFVFMVCATWGVGAPEERRMDVDVDISGQYDPTNVVKLVFGEDFRQVQKEVQVQQKLATQGVAVEVLTFCQSDIPFSKGVPASGILMKKINGKPVSAQPIPEVLQEFPRIQRFFQDLMGACEKEQVTQVDFSLNNVIQKKDDGGLVAIDFGTNVLGKFVPEMTLLHSFWYMFLHAQQNIRQQPAASPTRDMVQVFHRLNQHYFQENYDRPRVFWNPGLFHQIYDQLFSSVERIALENQSVWPLVIQQISILVSGLNHVGETIERNMGSGNQRDVNEDMEKLYAVADSTGKIIAGLLDGV